MSVRNDLLNLPVSKKKSIARLARKLLRELPNIHTITVEKRYDVSKPEELCDFELIVFLNAENEIETKRIIAESVYYKGSGAPSESYTVYDPGIAYEMSDRELLPDEALALHYEYCSVTEEWKNRYLSFISEHLKFFVKHDFMSITTINSPEMEKGNPIFYKLYVTGHFEKGYVIYNSTLKPFVSMPGGISDLAMGEDL